MSKQSGLADALLIDGYDLSGDTQMVGNVGGGPATLDVTAINKSAHERIGGLRDGRLDFTSFFDPAAGFSHEKLRLLPTTDVVCSYLRGTALGGQAASLVGKQVNYDATRAADGMLTFAVNAQANGFGLVWGRTLTAGVRTDTAATNGASIDTAASASFGWSAFLHVTAITGTSATVTLQDSADDAAWANLSGGAFTAATGKTSQRLAGATSTATVRRYLRAITTGTFTVASFVVVFHKGESPGSVF